MNRPHLDFSLAALTLTFGILGFPACDGNTTTSTADASALGTLQMNLQLVSGVTLSTVTYTITGPDSYRKTGTLNASLSIFLTGFLVGRTYKISIAGTATDGSTECAGSTTFDSVVNETTRVNLHLACHERLTTSNISVSATANICPVIDTTSVVPASVAVGSSFALRVTAHDTDNAPASLSYEWTTTAGTLNNASTQDASLACTAPGPVTVMLTVSDGDTTVACPATKTIAVTCTAL